MKQLLKISLLLGLVLAVSSCKVEDTIYIDLPMGKKTLTQGLAVVYDEGETTATGEVAAAKTYTLTINDDMFDGLNDFKNSEVTSMSVKDVTMKLVRLGQATGEEVRDLLIEAYIGDDKIDEYQNLLIAFEGANREVTITGDENLSLFMENVILKVVSGEIVELKYSGTYVTNEVFTGDRTAFNVSISQNMDAKITVRR